MANAAAKKSAAAREAASSTYLPLFLVSNLVYLLLRIGYRWSSFTPYHGAAAASLSGLSFFSYKGILDSHANGAGSGSGLTKGKNAGEPLAGGASLDLFGLIFAVQFGTVLVSDKIYWLLGVLPAWGGWKLYSMFYGEGGMMSGMGGGAATQAAGDDGEGDSDADKAAAAKREKRAERRRQKWS